MSGYPRHDCGVSHDCGRVSAFWHCLPAVLPWAATEFIATAVVAIAVAISLVAAVAAAVAVASTAAC